MNSRELEALGEPDLKIAGLHLWVHGREFPQSEDYWDGNWLRVTAYCLYPNSSVRTHGSIVHLGEIAGLLRETESLYKTLQGQAALQCMEPYLGIELLAQTGGHIRVKISITPDHMTETHSYTDNIDQSYLPPIVAGCQAILAKLPLREPEALNR
ncbi:WapI family immunity protein [Methylomonas sp. MS20]|uniref:WapI family immunity protein n=1 Tax=Methylomonas sp. MS20 TaxID=3418769 RepID=UPI003D05993E